MRCSGDEDPTLSAILFSIAYTGSEFELCLTLGSHLLPCILPFRFEMMKLNGRQRIGIIVSVVWIPGAGIYTLKVQDDADSDFLSEKQG
jgi:hypothetical protein